MLDSETTRFNTMIKISDIPMKCGEYPQNRPCLVEEFEGKDVIFESFI